MKRMASVFACEDKDVALLVLRIWLGCLLFGMHGYEKLFQFSEMQQRFPDPLNLGQTFSLILALVADSICSLLVLLGGYLVILDAGAGKYSLDHWRLKKDS